MMGWHQYAAAWADQHGGYDVRRSPASIRAWLRAGYGVGRGLASLRVSTRAVFGFGLVVAAAIPFAASAGPLGLLGAAGLVALSAFTVVVDRALTVLSARTSPRAAIRHAVAARLGEVGWLAGLWIVGVPGPLVVACGVLNGLYDLARQEALGSGMSPIGAHTLAERSMRVSLAVGGLVIAGLASLLGQPIAAGLLTLTAALWVVLGLIGASQLASAVRKSFR